jgi:hypothetical protein
VALGENISPKENFIVRGLEEGQKFINNIKHILVQSPHFRDEKCDTSR